MADTGIDRIAQDYVSLGLQLHNHDPNPYVFMGDEALRAEAQARVTPLADLDRALAGLRDRLEAAETGGDADLTLRRAILLDRAEAMQMRSGLLQGRMPADFDEEVRVLYSVSVPQKSEDHFRALAADLEQVVPGTGPLSERLGTFRDRFLIAPDLIAPVMGAALTEARARTLAHLDLPEGEGISVQIDTAGHHVGFAEYKGKGRTVVHFNRSVPIHADRVVELSTHEAYPGHHVQATLIEAELIDRRGWVEWTFLPLFGAHTVMAEGAANYGVRLAFDRAERMAFDRDVVLPQAGLAAAVPDLEDFHRFVDLVEQLNFARNEAARGFLYGGWDRERAIAWLMEFGLETRGTATQRLAFIEALRSYVVTYNHGLDWVTARIEGADTPTTAQKWQRLRRVIETPDVPLRDRAAA